MAIRWSPAAETAAPRSAPRATAAQTPAALRRSSYKERRELAAIEERIANLEAAKAALEEELNVPGHSYSAYQALANKLASTVAELDTALERWTELAELVGE